MVGAKTNAKELRDRINVFRTRLGPRLTVGFRKLGEEWKRDMGRRLDSGKRPIGVPSAGQAGSKSGRLERSLFTKVSGGAGAGGIEGRKLTFGARTEYTRVLELGTKGKGGKLPPIRPRKAKFLAIPLPPAYGGTSFAKTPREFAEAFVYRSRRGNLLIGRGGNDGSIENLFVLRKSVEIQPQLGLVDEFRKVLKNSLRKRMANAVAEAAAAAFGPRV